ncbi:MAG: hypothetical protein EOO77_10780 [Oxalobacteraceae bacterium]|nr:MAG: hypothetical protein EOO77_10780 [Oxalobacteraceae bacterium]
MIYRKSVVERAFELARNGSCKRTRDIRSVLSAEGYSEIPATFAGPAIKKQLRAAMAAVTLEKEQASAAFDAPATAPAL